MIRIKGRIVMYGEASYEEEPSPGVDIVIYRNRKNHLKGVQYLPNLSLISGLEGEADAISGSFDKDCRYKIRRADTKDGLQMEFLTEPEGRLKEFCAFFDAFAKEKSIPPSSY